MADPFDEYDSKLISLVAHDLKTPVGAIKGFLELVEHSGPLNESQMRFLGRAQDSLVRMEQLIASLLDYTRIHSGIALDMRVVDMQILVKESYELLNDVAAQRGISMHLSTNLSPIFASVDKRLLGHVISNLLSNAIKYNKKNGDVWVEIKKVDSTVHVDVRDTGIGISESMQARVFERFYRGVKRNENGNIEGSGLGLAICQSIIELHNGKIWVESALGEGSTFSFTVPIKSGEPAANEQISKEVHEP